MWDCPLQPVHLCVLGPPAVGKSTVCKQICQHYTLHHITLIDTITETISQLVSFSSGTHAVSETVHFLYTSGMTVAFESPFLGRNCAECWSRRRQWRLCSRGPGTAHQPEGQYGEEWRYSVHLPVHSHTPHKHSLCCASWTLQSCCS